MSNPVMQEGEEVHTVKTLHYMEYIQYATLQVNSKIFLLADVLLGGIILDLNKYIFPWQICFIWGAILYYGHSALG
jgi:hypothetical protein